jgi:hypothetical protein
LTGATFVEAYHGFSVGVAGNFANFSFENFDDASLVEVLGDTGYLAIDGAASAAVSSSTITAPFDGYFQYCPRAKALISTGHYQCSTVTPVTSATCISPNHRFTLARR